MAKSNPFKIIAKGGSEADLLIFGEIGESWWGDSVTAREVVDQLAGLDVETINVRINSYGGSVSDGLAIFNALRHHSASINVRIEGVAVSIASLIAMAGDTVQIAENAMFMVHAPWGDAVGNSKELRDYADVLDIYAKAMSSSYVRKSGQDHDTIMALLTDGQDHWYTSEEAKAFGFADEIIEDEAAVAAGFDKSRYAPSAFAAKSGSKHTVTVRIDNSSIDHKALAESIADKLTELQPEAADVAAITNQQEDVKMPHEETAAAKAQADQEAKDLKAGHEKEIKAEETARKTGIRATYEAHGNREGVNALLVDCLSDGDVTVEQAQAKLLAKLGEGAEPLAGNHIAVVEDERDKKIAAATNVLLVRAGVNNMRGNGVKAHSIELQGNPFVGASLMDMARSSLRAAGQKPDGMDKRSIVSAAFQGTSDFPILLENVLHKTLLAAYATAPDTWSRYCKIGTVSDFREHNRYRVGSIGNIDGLSENGELKTKTIPDGEKSSISVGTKGNIISITREAIINDDMEALTGLAVALGRGYRRTIEAAVYSLLAENGGLGPIMTDTKTLFHADHGNIGAAAAISMLSIDADRVLMAEQTDVGGNDYLDLRPAKLLVPIAIGGTARSINEAQYDPDTANKLQKPNIVNGLYDDIIDTPRIAGTRRYAFADPADAPVIEVAFLDGVQEPYIETKDGWSSAGAELRILGDFGVAAIDYRGATTNAGV